MQQGNRTSAFSLIELVVSIGVILILVGLVLPALGNARQRARATQTAVAVRSSGQAVVAYASDHDDIYPIASRSVNQSMLDWDTPLVSLGYFADETDIDPDGMRERGHHRFSFSGALVHPSRMMEPGTTVPMELAETTAIRQSQVSFPSEKGMMVQWVHASEEHDVFWTWSPWERPLSPVAFCDGSVSEHRCTDFQLAHDFFENWVGHPVLATWSGSSGIDRHN